MPVYEYKARDARGVSREGVSEAPTAEALSADLRANGLLVLKIAPKSETKKRVQLSFSLFGWLPATRFDIEIGLLQLSTMLHSGLTLLTALRTVGDQARRRRAAAVWRTIAENIERGATFSDSLAQYPRLFPAYIVQLIKVGENAGELDRLLTRAAEHLEQSRNMRLMVLNAITYPSIVVVMAVGVTAFMVLKVIPKVQTFLSSSGRTLPPITNALLDMAEWMRMYMPHVALTILCLVMSVIAVRKWPPGRRVLDAFYLRLPVIGGVFRLSETSIFARGMGILLESGVALIDSLRTVENLVRNKAVSARVAQAREMVTRGETLANGLAGHYEFLPIVSRMVAVGETTGALGQTLLEVAKFHETQLLAAVRRMSMLIEPVMILVVGGIVGFVYLAFFVALFSMATAAG